MATVDINTSVLTNQLQVLLNADDLLPGDEPSYQLCKTIYEYHPMGAKIVDYPLDMAQSSPRDITIPKGPEDRLAEAFNRQWLNDGADKYIKNICRLSRMYGIASIALMVEGLKAGDPVDYTKLADARISFNVFDPLNTSGSLVLSQEPNTMDFLKVRDIAVQGQTYHRSRTCTIMNEDPIYIGYTSSSFGYVGRSIFQRGLYPLKSFINTMITNDMVATKAGVLIAKLKQQSSAIDQVMATMTGFKRNMLKEAKSKNVITVAIEEGVESLNLQNIDGAFGMARKNIIEDIASATGTPAKLLLAETFAEGFGEGTEDAKHIAQYIDRLREWMGDVYAFFTKIIQYRAWSPAFYKTIQNDFPEEYGARTYNEAFYDWTNSFVASWPSLIEEPESEKVDVEAKKLDAVSKILAVILPMLDGDNAARVIQTTFDNINSLKLLFPNPYELDFEALAVHIDEMEQERKDAVKAGLDAQDGQDGPPGKSSAPKPKSSLRVA